MVAKAKKKAKKTTKRTAKKKMIAGTGGATDSSKTHTLTYFCKSGNCKVSTKFKHMDPDDVLVMFSFGTNATLTFTNGSPFVSGALTVNLVDGVPQVEVIVTPLLPIPRAFPYTLSCSSCGGGSVGNPEMIVP
jgi:BRCT domain type II-containing protein